MPFGAGGDTAERKTLSHDSGVHTNTKRGGFCPHAVLFLPSWFVTIGVPTLRNLWGCFSSSSLAYFTFFSFFMLILGTRRALGVIDR